MGIVSELEARNKRKMEIPGRGTLYVCDLTPELARMLAAVRDPKQRKVSKASLSRYAKHMRGGPFSVVGQFRTKEITTGAAAQRAWKAAHAEQAEA